MDHDNPVAQSWTRARQAAQGETRLKLENSDVLLLRPVQVAELLNISRSKVYELIAAGKLPSLHLEGGRLIRVPYKALLEWIEAAAETDEVR